MRLPRESRLTRKQQFDRVLNARMIQVRRGPFRVYAAVNCEGVARLGMIVGKRQAKRAVDRNRIKRALREAFRTRASLLSGLDVVVQLVDVASPGELATDARALWPLLHNEFEKGHDVRPTL